MYRAKYKKHKNKRSKPVILLASLVLLLTLVVGGTIAYLMTNTSSVTNTFTPARVTSEIEEDFDGKVKEDVTIKNTGNVDAYIRAAVIVNWVNSEGEVIIPRPEEAKFGHYVDINEDYWTESGGYYYYKDKVAPGALTKPLVIEAYPTLGGNRHEPKADDPYFLRIDIIADAIQADGMGATSAQDAWAKAAASNQNAN